MKSCAPTALSRGNDIRIAGVGVRIADIFFDGPREQIGLLQDHAHLLHQRLTSHLPDIEAVDGNTTLGDIGEAVDQGRQCALAGPGGSNQGHGLSWFNVQVDVLQHVDAWDVVKGDVIKPNLALDRRHL